MVSIHAPARGATSPRISHNHPVLFQSTRPQGARRALAKVGAEIERFNPRARKGRDDSSCSYGCQGVVSIHAPARGATASANNDSLSRMFQSTRPQGARHADDSGHLGTEMFQSTRPQGARRVCLLRVRLAAGFNPRARKGRDGVIWRFYSHYASFNPRARKGRDALK